MGDVNAMTKTIIIVIGFFILLTGCDQRSKVTALEVKVTTLETELTNLKQKIEMQEMVSDWDKVAYLTPGAEGYSLIKSDLGNLTVSIVNVRPYANGSKITLQFGNLTAATIDGLKTKLEWGPVDKEGRPKNAEAKSRDVIFNEPLISGSWTNSDVVLEGIPPIDLGFVRLRDVGHRGVKLRR
jgi:outer membrane murein-binding lipoprotein Lpp